LGHRAIAPVARNDRQLSEEPDSDCVSVAF